VNIGNLRNSILFGLSVGVLFIFVVVGALSISTILCAKAIACDGIPEWAKTFNDGEGWALNIVAGLASSIVVATGVVSSIGKAQNPLPQLGDRFLGVAWVYIAVWILFGILALILGIAFAGTLPIVDNLGKAWFGVAVGAVGALFSVDATATPVKTTIAPPALAGGPN
jgi:hypothetical protein